MKRTLDKWGKRYGIEILDPDGFDRTDPKLMRRRFTKAEFTRGVGKCTIQWGLGSERKHRRFERLTRNI